MDKRLYRSTTDSMLFGVCGGLAEYFGIDPTIIRVLFVLMTIFGGMGLIIYIICTLVVPERKFTSSDDQYSYHAGGSQTGGQSASNGQVPSKKVDSSAMIGMMLIGVGVILYMKRFIPWFEMELLWPAVLILIGGFIITKGRGLK